MYNWRTTKVFVVRILYYCAKGRILYTKACNSFKYFRVFWFIVRFFVKIVQNLTVLYGVLCNILKYPFLKSAFEMQMETRNFGKMFAAPSLRKTQGTFLKILWMMRMLHRPMTLRAHGHQHGGTLWIGSATPNWQMY